MRKLIVKTGWAFWLILLLACKSNEEPATLSIVSATIQNIPVASLNEPVEPSSELTIIFDGAIDPSLFSQNFSITSVEDEDPTYSFTYANTNTKVIISLDLNQNSNYTISLKKAAIGATGQVLTEPFSINILTTDTNKPIACQSSGACLRSIALSSGGSAATFSFYSNYPIENTALDWSDITRAIFVIHGINRNADDYFNWMYGTLNAANQLSNTLLIAPKFTIESEANSGDFYWSQTGWREGDNSISASSLSSFAILDSLIAILPAEQFPNLQKVMITGHSSGGLFTHLYSAANLIENERTALDFTYVVANSQYFYYPTDQRYDENSGQLYTPTDCSGYNFWPTGNSLLPAYANQLSTAERTDQLVNRSILYLLGNGSGPDGAFNDTDCYATLLGSTRYLRGENMFNYMNLSFPGNQHTKQIVEGVGHDGQGMYTSNEFRQVLQDW